MQSTIKDDRNKKTKKKKQNIISYPKIKKALSLETLFFLLAFIGFLGAIAFKMGLVNMLNTFMNTAYDLLMNTVLYIMAIAVLAGAVAGLLSEFGVIAAINKIVSPLMKPVYGLPGASMLGVLTTYLSDNPAILTLANDNNFKRYFKKYQMPALTNIGTAFGMGLIITTFMIGLSGPSGESFIIPVIIGNISAVVGSIISVRLMLIKSKKVYGPDDMVEVSDSGVSISMNQRIVRDGNIGTRFIEALLEGGKSGVHMGVAIIPGVLIICSTVLILTNGPGENHIYTGEAYEGIALLPWIADQAGIILEPLFGFSSPEAISVPITALGAAGAAIGLVPGFVQDGLVTGNDIAVFTAMCMCWSGYLSTHVAMMDTLNYRKMTGHAILSHTIAGLCAGIFAHYIYLLVSTLL